ncbi:Hemerythrin HHE cation binding domain-containing protein [Algoriphagus faecimaris]|uniref:Hemerythrin HHE cation binding domain-containing protein n=1 Tax=Algoriphagus faecimaris TaxID=686796 RepID=A0A1G6VPA1_9BACT|nr:hemerythrin domain-containing protein [Algoriphagus faecimaris]SDD54656.1 Hemerythrin HHE cation binding domain-containing protein [Algoriphagus faecimaris]
MKTAPLKRHPSLHHLSHDHHQGLLLCWKIRQGFKLTIEASRIQTYCEWFWKNHLTPHFEEEEEVIFPILEADHPLIKQAISEHKKLRRLFNTWENPEKTLGQIEEVLEKHIRFEERILFPEIQEKATAKQLEIIAGHAKKEKFIENNTDPFWIKAT